MFKRFLVIGLMLGMFLAAGILMYSLPFPLASVSLARAQAASSSELSALWLLDGAQLVALEPQTGQVLLRVPAYFAFQPTSRDEKWRYIVSTPSQESGYVLVTQLDLERGSVSKIFELSDSAYQSGSFYRNPITQVATSPDNQRLVMLITAAYDGRWYTRIGRLVDLATGESSTHTILLDPLKSINDQVSPQVWTSFNNDGSQLIVVQNEIGDGSQANWATKITLSQVNADVQLGISQETTRDISPQMKSNGQPVMPILSPDSKTLYLLQFETANTGKANYHFVAFDLDQMQVIRTQTVESNQDNEPFCNNDVRLSPDGRYLYSYCYGDITHRGDHFSFLDTQTGLVTQSVALPAEMTAENPNAFLFQYVVSPDQKQVYLVTFDQKQLHIAVLDVEQQAIVRSANVDTKDRALNFTDGLKRLLVNTANAKGGEGFTTSVVISPDGKRLYFSALPYGSLTNLELLAIDTSSLQVAGHWLKGQPITGLKLNRDGSELYALSSSNHTLFVLDAATGQVLRSFDKVLTSPSFAP